MRSPDVLIEEEVLREVMLALSRRTVDDRNVVRLGIAANAPTKRPANHIRCALSSVASDPVSLPPPQAETARVMAHPEICVQYDAINAVRTFTEIVFSDADFSSLGGISMARAFALIIGTYCLHLANEPKAFARQCLDQPLLIPAVAQRNTRGVDARGER
jgi:hypothetical protein